MGMPTVPALKPARQCALPCQPSRTGSAFLCSWAEAPKEAQKHFRHLARAVRASYQHLTLRC